MSNQDQKLPTVRIETEFGNIDIVLESYKAPLTTANFLRYVDEGYYTNHSQSRFYRTVTKSNQPDNEVKIEVIQGGLGLDQLDQGKAKYPPVPLERTHLTGLLHKDGTVSMGRLGPDTATSEIFICIGDQPELDYNGKRNPDGQGFAAFGKVINGMEVVRRIHESPAEGQMLTPPIKVISIQRLNKESY